jgi:hypothetical protein
MKQPEYNWWTDPNNADEVAKLSWWEHAANKVDVKLPISVISNNGTWVASTNEETEKLLGDGLTGVAQAKTQEDAINKLFLILRMNHEFAEEKYRDYMRWVPFMKGDWSYSGGRWFTVFGINVYFRYGKNMKRGFYVPLTKLNIMVSSHWTSYKKYLLNRNK